MQQETVSCINFDDIETRGVRASRSGTETVNYIADVIFGHLPRRRPCFTIGFLRRTECLPWTLVPLTLVVGIEGRLAVPRSSFTRLSPGVGKLNTRRRSLVFYEARDAAQRLYLTIVPEPEVPGRSPGFRGNCRRLREDKAATPERKPGQVSEVPIICVSVMRGILAHGRHTDPV